MRRTTLFLALLGLTVFSVAGCEMPEGTDTASNDAATDNHGTPPDNTAVNERDADGDTLTPLDQGQGEADVQRTADIRSKVMEIDNLSTYGQNVKIITNNGHVTLRGPVDSADERAAIEKVAVSVAGAGQVTNNLEVASSE
jgi:osmotically-inducible protein OsmY